MIYKSSMPDVEIPNVPLQTVVLENADELADKAALIDGPSGRTITYGQLKTMINRTASGLSQRGFKKGEVFAIYSPNLPEYAVAFFGVTTAGGVVTTINPLYTADELAYQLNDANAKYLLTIPMFLENARAAAAKSKIEEIFVLGEGEGATPFAELLQNDAPAPQIEYDTMEDLVALPYSSGTTGLSKGVMLTHHNIVANIMQSRALDQSTRDDVSIGLLPFYHIYGMAIIMSIALHHGMTIVTMPRFDLAQFLELMQKYKVTGAYVVPPIVLALAKHPIVDQYDLSALRFLNSGAAPLPEPVAIACGERLNCVVKQGYGLTETSPVTHSNAIDAEIRVTSVGRAIPNTEFRLVDVATGEDVAQGEKGEVWIRGPQVMKGYLNRPDATRDMLDEEGWLHTGDIGYIDEDEYLYVIDRVKELIKYKGLQVAPAEMEAVLQGHPAIADVGVIPRQDEEAGEIPVAYVMRKPDIDMNDDALAQDIMAYVAERVAPYKKIRAIVFIAEIPKTASGKILRRTLVEQDRAS